jgi:hypothetical protein
MSSRSGKSLSNCSRTSLNGHIATRCARGRSISPTPKDTLNRHTARCPSSTHLTARIKFLPVAVTCQATVIYSAAATRPCFRMHSTCACSSVKTGVRDHLPWHSIFVIDRSSSMSDTDRRPLAGTPTTQRIAAACNNRLGAVYSALYAFWSARAALHNAPGGQAPIRRDAYSVILFDHEVTTAIANDFQNGPDALLNVVLAHRAQGGTNYERAMSTVQTVMEQHWSTDRFVLFCSHLATFRNMPSDLRS